MERPRLRAGVNVLRTKTLRQEGHWWSRPVDRWEKFDTAGAFVQCDAVCEIINIISCRLLPGSTANGAGM